MKRFLIGLAMAISFLPLYSPATPVWSAEGKASLATAEPLVGKPAPNFAAMDSDGKTHNRDDYRNKVVVLEWINDGCPFVQKHYKSGNMQQLQKTYTKKDVVWLSVCSSAPGKPGYHEPAEIKAWLKQQDASPTAFLIDATGAMGHAYGARTTPAMYVIGKAGKIVYAGAIDDKPDTDAASVKSAHNFVKDALEEELAGKPVKVSYEKAYGCSVKYKD